MLQELGRDPVPTAIPRGGRPDLSWLEGIVICRVIEHAVWVDRGLVGRRGVIRLTEIRVLVGSVGRRRIVEVESATFTVIGEVERREARAKSVRPIVKARDPAAQVEVVQVCSDQGLKALPTPLAKPVDHEKQQ